MAVRTFLKILSGPQEGLNIPLSAITTFTIGRREGDLTLDDPLVSGRHCNLFFRGGEWIVQDLGSTNGTMVEGRLAREAAVRPGQEVSVGSTRLVLLTEGEEDAPDHAAAATPAEEPVAAQELAWLLDEELAEQPAVGASDVIGQELRLPPGVVAHLEVVAGQDMGRVYRFLRGNVNIGRRAGEVPLSDGEVSRRHAVVEVFGRDMVFLRDLGSTNGTYHNGRRMAVARIHHGDTVGVGKTVLKLDLAR